MSTDQQQPPPQQQQQQNQAEGTAMEVDSPAPAPSTAPTTSDASLAGPTPPGATATLAAPPPPPPAADPPTLNGCWILDKSKGNWSMRGYLEAMNVNELAIKAHEKGEQEYDTFHTIQLTPDRIKITKRSRVNADLVVDLPLGVEQVEYLPPGDRPKKSLAISNHASHLQIQSSLHTVNGVAKVTDIKHLQSVVASGGTGTTADASNGGVMVVQTLTIVNEQTGKTHSTTRYFIPYRGTPPHEVMMS